MYTCICSLQFFLFMDGGGGGRGVWWSTKRQKEVSRPPRPPPPHSGSYPGSPGSAPHSLWQEDLEAGCVYGLCVCVCVWKGGKTLKSDNIRFGRSLKSKKPNTKLFPSPARLPLPLDPPQSPPRSVRPY